MGEKVRTLIPEQLLHQVAAYYAAGLTPDKLDDLEEATALRFHMSLIDECGMGKVFDDLVSQIQKEHATEQIREATAPLPQQIGFFDLLPEPIPEAHIGDETHWATTHNKHGRLK